MLEFDRKDLAEMRPDELAPLEALMSPEWPDTWRELATSQFVTLLSAPGAGQVAPSALAQLAVVLTMGIAQDMGGDAALHSCRCRCHVQRAGAQGGGFAEPAAQLQARGRRHRPDRIPGSSHRARLAP